MCVMVSLLTSLSSTLVASLPVLVGFCATFCFVDLLWKIWTHAYRHIPGPRSYPFVGNALQFEKVPHKVARQFDDWAAKYGTPYVVWFGPVPMVMLGTPDDAEAILSSQAITEKSSLSSFLTEWLGNGLLLSSGKKWKRRRFLITPAFHFAALNSYREIMDDKAKILVCKLSEYADETKVFDVQTPVGLCSLDIICEAAMGVNCQAQREETSEYVQAVLAISRFAFRRMRSPHLWLDFAFRWTDVGKRYGKVLNLIHSHTRQVIAKRLDGMLRASEADDNEKKRVTFLDLLLDLRASGDIDTDGVCEEVDTFMFAGHDTTASGISWILYLLGRHPEIQERVWQEVHNMTEAGKRSIMDVVGDLKFLECVIRESMRMYPPVPVVATNIVSDFTLKGWKVPKGTQLGLLIHKVHRDPNAWQSPEDFLPERFMSKDVARLPFQYVPFSAGPRNCIGHRFAMLEQKIVIANMVLRFRVASLQSDADIEMTRQLVSRSSNGLMLQISRR